MIKEIKYVNQEEMAKIYVKFTGKRAFEAFRVNSDNFQSQIPEISKILIPKAEDRHEMLILTTKDNVGMLTHILLALESDMKSLDKELENLKDLTPQQIESLMRIMEGLK